MKTRLTIAIILCYSSLLCAQNINPTWRHVGPFSTNAPNLQTTDPDYNPFLTGQIDGIAVDPTTPNHILVSSFFAGIFGKKNL